MSVPIHRTSKNAKSKEHSLNTQNLSPSDDLDPRLAAHAVGNGSGVLARVHEQKLELGKVVDEELLVAGGEEVTGLLVGTVTNLGHRNLALEPSSNLRDSVVSVSSPISQYHRRIEHRLRFLLVPPLQPATLKHSSPIASSFSLFCPIISNTAVLP